MQIDAPSGLIGLWDPSAVSFALTSPGRELVSDLRRHAKDGALFFIDAEDHVSYRIDLLLASTVEEEFVKQLEPRGGSFRLRVPSGSICLGALPASETQSSLTVPAGEYLVVPYTKAEFEPAKYDAEMRQQVGERHWSYRRRIDKIGVIGCVAWVALAAILAIPATRSLWRIAVPLLLLPWLVHFALTKTRRYRQIEQARETIRLSLPDIVLVLRPSTAASELPGGWIMGL